MIEPQIPLTAAFALVERRDRLMEHREALVTKEAKIQTAYGNTVLEIEKHREQTIKEGAREVGQVRAHITYANDEIDAIETILERSGHNVQELLELTKQKTPAFTTITGEVVRS